MTTRDHDSQEPRSDGSEPISGMGSAAGRESRPIGEYDDADVPDRAEAGHDVEPTGEYTDRDVPDGHGAANDAVEREGEYTDKDVTDADTHAPVRSFTDSDIPD